jgi:ribonuclease HIII
VDAEITHKLESLLRLAQLLFPTSSNGDDSKEYGEVYANICSSVLNQQTVQTLWHEPVLLQLNWLFEKTPPNSQRFGHFTNQLVNRARHATQINNLFFSILDPTSSAEDVYGNLSKICIPDQSLLPRFVASGQLERIRRSDESPSTKISSFFQGFKDDLGLDLSEQDSIKQSLDCLKHREVTGRAYALLVRSGRDSALMVPLDLYFEPGEGHVRCAVHANRAFEAAVHRAQMALQRGGFLAKSIDVVYSLELTDSEYTGSSIGLAAAAAMFTRQRQLAIDPYTAFTGDVKLENDEWKIKSVTGLSHKLSAARLNGCRRVFIPQESRGDFEADEEGDLQVIGVENIGQILLHLEANPQPLMENSIQAKKQNIVRAHCQAAGWPLSEPWIIQNGVQYRVTPLSTQSLTVTIYDSGTHLPKEPPHQDYRSLLTDLASLDNNSIPICSRNKTYELSDASLRNEVAAALRELRPEHTRDEQHCDYSFEYKRGKERLIIKQYKSGKLQVQGSAGELYRTVIECIVSRYKLHYPSSSISLETEFSPNGAPTPISPSASKPFQPVPFPHIGTDESGKGDYFGPMVVAGVMVDQVIKDKLERLGVKDSKLLSDKQCRTLATQIRAICGTRCEEIDISPEAYNRLYDEFKKEGKNLNHLLAWGLHGRLNHFLSAIHVQRPSLINLEMSTISSPS